MVGKRAVRAALCVLTAAALMVLGGCERDENGGTAVRLMLDWVPNVNHVGIYVANELGYFADAGLDVEILIPGEVYPAAAVLAGEVEFGIDYQEYLTLLSEREQGLVSVAAILQSNTSGFAVREGLGVQGFADLDGLRYGTFHSPFEEPTLRSLVECAGVAGGGEFEFLPAGTDVLALLGSERADFAWIFYGTQGVQAEELGVGLTYLPMNEHFDCIPDYYTPVVITSREFIERDPGSVRAFLSALGRGHYAAAADPVGAARALSAAAPELDENELRRSIPWLAGYMFTDAGQWGYQESGRWLAYAEWMYGQGLLEQRPTAAGTGELFTNDYADPDWRDHR